MSKKQQSSQYDKIIKENIEAVMESIVRNVLHIKVASMEELPDDIQHTKERKPDVLKKVTDELGKTFALQIEFQVADEPDMVFRMLEYYVMLERKYRIPVRQFVIFLGTDVPKMKTTLNRERLKFSFPLITFSTLNYHLFLNSDKPEEIILSILADFENDEPKVVLKQIVSRIEETTKSGLTLGRYFNQLRVLAQLRKLEIELKDAMKSITEYFSEERDVLYMRGQEKEQTKFITFLLKEGNRTLQQIADIAEVNIDFVVAVQQKISSEK